MGCRTQKPAASLSGVSPYGLTRRRIRLAIPSVSTERRECHCDKEQTPHESQGVSHARIVRFTTSQSSRKAISKLVPKTLDNLNQCAYIEYMKKQTRRTPFRMQVFVGFSPVRCQRCGDQIIRGQFATECRVHVEGTAGTRTRSINWICEDCTAAGEYQQELAREAYRAELIASLESKS